MRMTKIAVAAVAALALGVPAVGAPEASAAVVQVTDGVRVDQNDAAGAFNGAKVTPGRTAKLRYSHPFSVPGQFDLSMQTDAWVGSTKIPITESNTEVKAVGENEVESVTRAGELTLKRTFTFSGPTVAVDVELSGLQGRKGTIYLSSYQSDQTKLGYTGTSTQPGAYTLTPVEPGYEFDLTYEEDPYATTVQGTWENLATNTNNGQFGTGEAAVYQRGVWESTDKDVLRARAVISGRTQQSAADSDGDGLPDKWEDEGFTIPRDNGQAPLALDLPRWGARADRKDLFLQLNWMPSEWESNGCANPSRYNPTTGEYQSFEQCASYNKNMYRPSRQTFLDLEKVFRAQGIELHIDAGPLYAPGIAMADRRGGQLDSYEQYAAGSDSATRIAKLQSYNRELLGDRAAVWHVGVIGDKISEGEQSSGIGLKGESFFVAKGAGLDTSEELRGTILHEFGHVLGLDHDGAPSDESAYFANLLKNTEAGERNFIPEYNSAMNYLYQMSEKPFNYSTEKVAKQGPTSGALYQPCKAAGLIGKQCFIGQANIEPDWQNLAFRTSHIGKADGIVGLPDASSELIEEDITAYELAVLAAEENNGRAGLTTDDRVAGGNGVVVGRPTNKVTVNVKNKGLDPHTFKVKALWGDGQSKQETIALKGILDRENSNRNLAIDLGSLPGVKGAKMPVEFVVTNEKNQEVFRETFRFPVLDYTPAEAQKVLEEVKKDPAIKPEEKQRARDRLEPVAESTPTPTPTATKPIPTRTTSTPIERPVEKPVVTSTGEAKPAEPKSGSADGSAEGSSDNGGIIAGVMLTIAGALAALFGWWYNNGGQFPTPF